MIPPPLPRTLRARLTLAFAAIIAITLLLGGLASAFILREYQLRREIDRVAELTLPLSGQVRAIEQLGASTEDVAEYVGQQAEELDLRVVLADRRGRIFADTASTLVGRQLEIDNTVRHGTRRRVRQATVHGPEGEILLMVSPTINPPSPQADPSVAQAPGGDRLLGRQSAYVVALGVPPNSLAGAWLELLPRLALAAGAALVLSIAVAWPLAASIARPLAGMTRAAEEIARGRLDQEIPVHGRDEVARLAIAFNRMAREVANSQRTLRDFIANVSHDLRTPLTSIQGFSQALTDGTLSEPAEIAEAGRVVNQEATRMSRLVDDLLFLSKMEAGQIPLQLDDLAPAELIAARVQAAARRAAEAGADLRWESAAAPSVRADRLHLERVIDNLLDNALRHTPSGGVVTVSGSPGDVGSSESGGREMGPGPLSRWERAAGEGPRFSSQPPGSVGRPHPRPLPAGEGAKPPSPSVVLSVHNTGSYIPPEDLPRVFERFYRVDKARSAGSSGLGLAISREIVQAHGGVCWAESSPDGGTTFFVLLPAVPASQEEREADRVADPVAEPPAVIPVSSANAVER